MMQRRRALVLAGLSMFSAPARVFCQSAPKVARIGLLEPFSQKDAAFQPFLEGLKELGYVQGRNLVLEARYANGDARRLATLASELVALRVDVIVTNSTPSGQAAQQATRTIPIVITATADPVADGFAKTLARPGGNVTGMSTGAALTVAKHLELLTAVMPKLERLAVLASPANRAHPPQLRHLAGAGRAQGMQVIAYEAERAERIEPAFAKMREQRAEALIVLRETLYGRRGRHIAELALKHRLPSVSAFNGFTADGGLMSYGDHTPDRHRRAAVQVDKILKGANPGDLPFELPTRFHFAINARTARALGLKIPHELLVLADRVVE